MYTKKNKGNNSKPVFQSKNSIERKETWLKLKTERTTITFREKKQGKKEQII